MTPEFLQALSAGRTVFDGLKMLTQYAEEVKDTQKRGEFMRLIGELSVELAQTQMDLANQIGINVNLKQKVDDLEQEIQQLKAPAIELTRIKELYYEKGQTIPYCPNCYIAKKYTLLSHQFTDLVGRFYRCKACDWEGFERTHSDD